FALEVPEISEKIIEIRALAREAGYRTKVAVTSFDEKVDPVGACVGVRGSRIKNIVDELGGEKIDIVRWNESSQVLVSNALMPAKVSEIALCFELGRATVVVDEEQLSLAIGKHGQNVRLAARLTGWDIDILTPEEYNQGIELLANCVKTVEGADETVVDKLIALGAISVADLDDIGAEPLVKELGIDSGIAEKLVAAATKEVERLAEESQRRDETEKQLAQQTKTGDGE
ncbi:MAG: transcription termination factor NusA, partial [Planctomycetota bacterium]